MGLDIILRIPRPMDRLLALRDISEKIAENIGVAVLGGGCYSKAQGRDGPFVDACVGVQLWSVGFHTGERSLSACFKERAPS